MSACCIGSAFRKMEVASVTAFPGGRSAIAGWLDISKMTESIAKKFLKSCRGAILLPSAEELSHSSMIS